MSVLATGPTRRLLLLLLLVSVGVSSAEVLWAAESSGAPEWSVPGEADFGSIPTDVPRAPPGDAGEDWGGGCSCDCACPCVANLTLPVPALRELLTVAALAVFLTSDSAPSSVAHEPPVPPPLP